MGIEIEKKYRLTREQYARLLGRLELVKATPVGRELEENTLYAGGALDQSTEVLRLRRVGGRAILTYKRRFASASAIKRHREDETEVKDARALDMILEALGYRPALVYEKRRATWQVAGAEVVLDELPFGLFLEIEGDEQSIREAERLLELADVEAEMETYPALARRYGEQRQPEGLIEARFQMRLPNA
ncbi:MAG TPA: class IV adenylate cyclase [Pyrinomonadaceae bacterium]|jgi:adenylate cyclase class 2|nr:class IV adenylate cyclase [Pyrinomonadaceae bacterium]